MPSQACFHFSDTPVSLQNRQGSQAGTSHQVSEMHKSVLPGLLHATENDSKIEALDFKWYLSSLQKDLLSKSLGALPDIL